MKKVLFLVGPHASGKTYSANRYKEGNVDKKICVIDTGPIMRRIHDAMNPGLTMQEWIDYLERTYGKNITSKIIANEIGKIMDETDGDKFIIIGFRSLSGINFVTDNLKIDNYRIVYLDADLDLLYNNYELRINGNISKEEFKKKIDYEMSLGLDNLRELALSNDSTIRYYCKRTNEDIFNMRFNYIFDNMEQFGGNKFCKLSDDYTWPVIPQYRVLEHDKYGLRPIHMILGKPRFHSGFDITARTLTPVKASIDGVVVSSGLDEKIVSGVAKWNERYGNKVEILDENGRRLIYAHLRETLVQVGNVIKQGQVIGLSGCSGGSRIPHLHFEVRKHDTFHSGEANTVNPLLIMPEIDLLLLTKKFDEEPYAEIWQKFSETPWGLSDDDIPYANNKKLIR